MLSATCHCAAVTVRIPRRPRTLTNCNCSLCRRYGPLWAYYRRRDIEITAAPGATASYAWGDRQLRFVRCATCGCLVNWEGMHEPEKGRAGVNARLFEPERLGTPRIRRLDGAKTWRCLRDDEQPGGADAPTAGGRTRFVPTGPHRHATTGPEGAARR